jgi:hypothetical protein
LEAFRKMNLLPNPWTESFMTEGGPEEAPAAACQNPAATGLFVLDERSFMEALEQPPLFLRPGFAADLMPVLQVLAGY